jgi:hypothetical protein
MVRITKTLPLEHDGGYLIVFLYQASQLYLDNIDLTTLYFDKHIHAVYLFGI